MPERSRGNSLFVVYFSQKPLIQVRKVDRIIKAIGFLKDSKNEFIFVWEVIKMSGKKTGIFKEFKEFITRGNVLDMAVGIIIGGAFTAIVNSLVNDILNPFINTIFGGFGFDGMNLAVKLPWVTLMRNMGLNVEYPVFAFGNFISAVISFLITAVALFFLIKGINAVKKLAEKKKADEEAPAPTTKICPYCRSEINIEATRCPHCTSQL